MIRPIDDSDKPPEHLPTCGGRWGRCVRGCPASRSWAPVWAVHHPAPGESVLTEERSRPHYPEGKPALPPLWELQDAAHHEYLRAFHVAPQYAETYARYERDASYNLDEWTTETGGANVDLEMEIFRRERARTAKILQTNEEHRAKVVAIWIREVFPGVALLDDVTDAHNGFLAGCFAGIVWGLALYMFGLTHDPLPEHISGRILKGAPVRDTRAPFRDVFAVLTQRSHALLGAGNASAFPTVDRRARRRDFSIDGEIHVSPSHSATDTARGEVGINRALSAEAAIRRAGLGGYEQWQAEAHLDRSLTREQRVRLLREGLLIRRGGSLSSLVTEETQRMRAMHDMTYVHELADHQRRLSEEPDPKKRDVMSEAFADRIRARLDAIAARTEIDREEYPRLLREATDDVSDRDLLEEAKACAAALRHEVYRESSERDELASQPRPQAPRRTAQPSVWEVTL